MNSNTPALSAFSFVALVGLALATAFPAVLIQADSVSPSSPAAPTASTLRRSTAGTSSAAVDAYLVPLFPSASDTKRQGFVRVINRSDTAGEVSINATDDSGDLAPGATTLSIGPGETAHFNSEDLEQGDPDKDLSGGTGTGNGDWRLELTSDLDLEVLSFIRTEDGFLTAMHDVVKQEPAGHRVAIFNPGKNESQKSMLRLINPGTVPVEVTITGTDDTGISPGSGVTAIIPAGGARTLTAAELESGKPPSLPAEDGPDSADLGGSLSEGTGKWQLLVMSDEPITVMSLLQSPTGHLTNLSTAPSTKAPPPPVARHPRLEPLILPEGFHIRIVTAAVVNARQLALAADGTLFVGTLDDGRGQVYAVSDALASTRPEVVVLASGLVMPSGVAERGGDLYVAALNRVLRFPAIGRHLAANAPYEEVTRELPNRSHHGWKYIKFGPGGRLYVPVGAPCNICLSDDPRFASLLSMDPVSGATNIVAEGIRNTVGFAWHPQTQHLWFTDNGRDWMGDDVPPDEVNEITVAGQHFGYPFVHGADVLDPTFGNRGNRVDYTPPVVEIQAHAAALGADFYTGDQFPSRYRNALFIAEHGSWNRSSKVGYQVSAIVFEGGEPRYEPFITGWLEGQNDWGRPNDVLVAPDGSLLISDDKFGAVYQVTYTGN